MLSPAVSKFVALWAVLIGLVAFTPFHSTSRAQSEVDTPVVANSGIDQVDPITGLTAHSDAPKSVDETVTFTATVKTGSGITFTWDFGDGSPEVIGIGANGLATHRYATPGTYTAFVIAKNANSAVVATLPIEITAQPITGLMANASPQPTQFGESTQFTARVMTPPQGVTYRWDFGDGTSGFGQNISHTYARSGDYVVTVTASHGEERATVTLTVKVVDISLEPLEIVLLTNPSDMRKGKPVRFQARTPGSDVNYSWQLGDGTVKTGKDISHVYDNPGTYTVILVATNSVNTAVATMKVVILENGGSPPSTVAYLPLIRHNFSPVPPDLLPDLIVEHVTVHKDNLEITLKNIGTAAVSADAAFWVDAYINPKRDRLPIEYNEVWQQAADQGIVWGVKLSAPIDPYGTIKLRVGGPYYIAGSSWFDHNLDSAKAIYVQVDSANTTTSYGGVLESHEKTGGSYNNVWCRDYHGCVVSAALQ